MKADNAVIMAAGTASRFAPLSYERPKALIEVRGEVLIERQIRQLRDAGIDDVIIVTGYMKDRFGYLKDLYGVKLVENREYLKRNNNSTIMAVREYLSNTYICSSDNYFTINPFEKEAEDAYYAAVYSDGDTREWCMTEDEDGYISSVNIGGRNAWYMLGHAFWSREFSERFLKILDDIYDEPSTSGLLWEAIFMAHLYELKMKIRKYPGGIIFEFDTLDELRAFDESYINDTRSAIIKKIAGKLCCSEKDIVNASAFRNSDTQASGFTFDVSDRHYRYSYDGTLREE